MDVKGVLDIVLPVLTLLAGWVFKMIWDSIQQKSSSSNSDIKDLTRVVIELRLSVQRLEIQLETHNKILGQVEKSKEDITVLHNRVRELHRKGSGNGSSD